MIINPAKTLGSVITSPRIKYAIIIENKGTRLIYREVLAGPILFTDTCWIKYAITEAKIDIYIRLPHPIQVVLGKKFIGFSYITMGIRRITQNKNT